MGNCRAVSIYSEIKLECNMHIQENKCQKNIGKCNKADGYPLLTCITVTKIIKAIYMPRSTNHFVYFLCIQTKKLLHYWILKKCPSLSKQTLANECRF